MEIHEFIDSTKVALPDLRHRMILHSVDLGGELAARAFPSRPDVRDVVRGHIIEDIGQARTLSDWLSHCDMSRTPQPHPHPAHQPVNEDALVAAERERQALAGDAGPRDVLQILRLPLDLAPEYADRAWCVLCNSFGPSVVRRILGPPREVAGAKGSSIIFDPGLCAEGMIFGIFRTIPETRSVVMALRTSHQRQDRAQDNL